MTLMVNSYTSAREFERGQDLWWRRITVNYYGIAKFLSQNGSGF